MKILFITPNPLGDTVLSMGVLNYLIQTYPQADFTIATGPLGHSLFDGFPRLKDRVSLKKQKWHGHWIDLWKKTVLTRWDIVVDMRNSAVSRLIRTDRRYIKGRGAFDSAAHVVLQNAQVIDIEQQPPSPHLWLSDAQKAKALDLMPGDKIIGIGPTANFIGKMWPNEYFIELLNRIAGKGGVFSDYRIAVFGAPDEKDQVITLLESLYGSLGQDRVLNLVGATNPGAGAACLGRCALYIGNDSGLMHIAAALDVPTFGLFGPSRDENYSPWGKKTAYIRTPESRDDLIGYEGFDSKAVTDSLMRNLTVDQVEEKLLEFWKEC